MLTLESLVKAMARIEGFYANDKTPNRPQRNNNPGDLEYHDWMANKYKVLGSDGRFAIFANADEGFKAMTDILSSGHYLGLNVMQIVTKWNGRDQSNNTQYAKAVCALTNCDLNDIPTKALTELLVTKSKDNTHNDGVLPQNARKVV